MTKKLIITEIPTIDLLYICDSEFKKAVKEIRKQFNIKSNNKGVISTEEIMKFDSILISNTTINKKYSITLDNLCKRFNLEDYYCDVDSIVSMGHAPYAGSGTEKDKLVYSKRKIGPPEIKPRKFDIPGSGCTITFVVRGNIFVKDIEQWAKKHKDSIVIRANDYFKGNKKNITKLDKLDRAVQIITLRDIEKLRFVKIADKICEQIPNDQDVIDGKVNEVSVRQMYHRYKKRFKNVTL